MFQQFGIRARLLLAFFGISTFAVLAAAAALYSFYEVGRALDRISRNHTPEAILSLELSRQAERVVNAASAMLTVKTTFQREQVRAKTAVEAERLQKLVSQLKSVGQDKSLLDTIDWTAQQLFGNLENINILVENRLQMSSDRDALLQRSREAIAKIKHLLSESIAQTEYRMAENGFLGNGVPRGSNDRTKIGSQPASLKLLRATLQRASEHVTTIHDIVLDSQTESDPEKLSALAIQSQISADAFAALIMNFDKSLAEAVTPEIEKLGRSLGGDKGLFSQILLQNRTAANARDVMIENSWLSGELSATVDELVSQAKGNITQAISQVNSTQTLSIWVVVVVVTLSLICSTLIVWLYVGRNVIARLTELSTAMESVAGGDLRIDLPGSGPDEIGRMVDALTVFRNTAIEIEEDNLREIGQARQRLVDAIESILEGFCYFDADDKLVVANNRYRKLMQAGGQRRIEEGMTFESIIRSGAEAGYIEDAKGNVEQWIAKRLERHRNPGAPHIVQRSEGQWLMISERRTGDGGTVAVYSDITELKQREAELAEKSESLEQLSSQIAKYLSPQVYESIFTGKKEVKVASHRRKLTVFFSDIAGFTETADQMESEDLTRILNHYLTEMTQIALAHGATIDKYVGDAIVIFFGDPETRGVKEDALACVKMAIAMRERMIELHEIWRDSGVVKPLRCRIGINTGFCTVGNFGSEDRLDYTIIGSGVNLASRLESSATPGEILIAYETYALVKDEVRCQSKGELRVKGQAYPIETYEVIDTYDKLGAGRELIREEHPHFHLSVDLGALSVRERHAAADILSRTLQRLDATGMAKQSTKSNKYEPTGRTPH